MPPGGGRKVMIVEDSADLAWLASFHLRDAGYEVDAISGDWRQVFDIARWLDVDVAVVDLHLRADITGVDILRWLAEYLPGIRRVVFTASIDAADGDPYAEAVEISDAFVPKLEVVAALVDAVRG